jgi:outer membrane beta-barrel protein/carboxypeptidase family protein
MFKTLVSFFLLIAISFNTWAQESIKGRIIDRDGKPIGFTSVVLLHPNDSTMKYFGVSNDQGNYEIKRIKDGNYLMQFSFAGFETAYEKIRIPSENGTDFGDKIMSPIALGTVIVEAELIPMTFKTDTLEFNVKAFQTRPGASVEELLEKLPGMEVDESGNVKAQGEDVLKVLVDGKEFFGDDPKVATKNLPAKALEKVQVFDRKSEEASFTGIDDGVRTRTINLLLNEEHKSGYFGEAKGGLGTGESYKAEGKLFRFSSSIQAAVLGMYNNINEFGFTNKGNQLFGQSNKGLNSTLAGGLNLSYNTTGFNRYFISYLGNSRKNELSEQTATENFLEQGEYQQFSDLNSTEKDQPHNINFGIRHDFNKANRFILNGNFSAGTSDLVSQSLTDSELNATPINQLQNSTIDNSNAKHFNANASYIAKLKGDTTQFNLRVVSSYNENLSQLNWTNVTTIFDPLNEITTNQLRNNNTDDFYLGVTPKLVQKLNKFWAIDAAVTFGLKKENLYRNEGIYDDNGEFVPFTIPSFEINQPSIRPSLSINRGGTKTSLNFSIAGYSIEQEKKLDTAIDKTKNFYLLPSLNYRNQYRSGRRVDVRYISSVTMPNANQLFPVPNTQSLISIYQGNINLRPEVIHNAFVSWNLFDEFSFTSFSVRLNGRFTQDKISWSQFINENLVKVTTPVNVTNARNFNTYMNFAAPIRSLGLKLSLTNREIWNKGRVIINDVENINTSLTHMLDMNFENRTKEKWNIKVGGSISKTNSKYSVAETQNNSFFNTTYYTNLRFTPNRKWNLQAKANVVNYNSQSFDDSVTVPLITASISYFFMQAEKASLTLSGFDLLNKYVGFQQISLTNYIMQKEWNTLGRYAMLTFSWRLRK